MFLQYFDTVGWVFWPVKTVAHVTYTVLVEGDVKPCSINQSTFAAAYLTVYFLKQSLFIVIIVIITINMSIISIWWFFYKNLEHSAE